MTTTAVEVFQFPETGQPLRSVQADGEANFVAADAATVLELGNVSSSLALLDDDEKGLHTVETPGGPQQMATVTEAGLYSLILRSRKPQAKAFKRWITHEVLPAIRKTGRYELAPALPTSYAEALRELAATVEERDAASAALAAAAPAADAWNHLASANGDFSVADAAKILSRDPNISIGRDRLFTLMDRWSWVYRPGGFDRYRVYQTQIETGRLSELPSSHYHPRTGELVLDPPQVRVTAKGMQEIRNRLTKETAMRGNPGTNPHPQGPKPDSPPPPR
jgi:anti-repressor protein